MVLQRLADLIKIVKWDDIAPRNQWLLLLTTLLYLSVELSQVNLDWHGNIGNRLEWKE